MRHAIAMTAKAFSEVRANLAHFKTEYQVEAEFTYRFRKQNAQHAYEPIVASGATRARCITSKTQVSIGHGKWC